MLIRHLEKTPFIHQTAYVAPSATVCGEVSIGPHSRVLFGAVITAESGPVEIGEHCIVMENAVIRGVKRHPVRIGNHILIGPHAHLSGCIVEDEVFIATGASIFNGAHLGANSVVRINGIVHIKTVLPPNSLVPIGWVAIGEPPEILPPGEDRKLSHIMRELGFSKTVFGLNPAARGKTQMDKMTARYTLALGRYQDHQILPSD